MTTAQTTSAIRNASPNEVFAQQHSSLLLDVRTPAEFEQSHIKQAILHPVQGLNTEEVQRMAQGKRETVLVCGSGNRAKQAAEKLAAAGMTSLVIMEGGMRAWEQAGLDVVRGKETISLERQVRIAAGGLVVLGSLLGYAVNPAWIALSAFVGAGLVFAGVTDTCGMAMLLARMPWNNRRPAQAASCCMRQ